MPPAEAIRPRSHCGLRGNTCVEAMAVVDMGRHGENKERH